MRRGRPPYPGLLTPREQQVLNLIREGLTNEQIAVRLGISFSGARYHVAEILSKLGVSNRQDAALWTPQPQDATRYGLLAWLALRIKRFSLAKAAAGMAVAAGVALPAALLVGTVVMKDRAQTPAAEMTSERSAGPELQVPQLLPTPQVDRYPRPDERWALPVDLARRELSKNPDLARVIAAAESGDVTSLLDFGQRADERYCSSWRGGPAPGCETYDDKLPAVYHDIGVLVARTSEMMGTWLGNMYADNPAKLTFAARDSRFGEGDGGKYYLLFTLSNPATAGGPEEVGGLALIVTPGSPHPIETFAFSRPGGLGLAWVQDYSVTQDGGLTYTSLAQFLVLITPETVKDWPDRGPPR
jgi:DNA-binding CsgD family transcriptional regulator